MDSTFFLRQEFADLLSDRHSLAMAELHKDAPDDQKQYLPSQCPSLEQIKLLTEVSFWASLIKQEARYHGFSIVFSNAEREFDPFVFRASLPFTPERLAKLAPALERQATIGVWPDQKGELCIWGFTPSPRLSLSVRTFEPGKILISLTAGEKSFTSLITGSRAEFIDRASFPMAEAFIDRRAPFSTRSELVEALITGTRRSLDLGSVAKAMRSHNHGGTLLVVPENENWIESIHQPIIFTGNPYEKVKADLKRARDAMEQAEKQDFWASALLQNRGPHDTAQRSIEQLAQLTAIDGATVATNDLTVLAFGVKIKPVDSGHVQKEDVQREKAPKQVLFSEPFEGSSQRPIDVSDLGGTRHQSAVQFVFDQKNSVAIVASQDGKVSVLAWDLQQDMVAVSSHAEFALL